MVESVPDFQLVTSFEPRPQETEFDEEYAAEFPPLLAAIRRFEHDYFHSAVEMKAGARADQLELAFDVAYAITQLPGWLKELAVGGRAVLGFAAQGSERELIAERDGEEIVYWLRPFFSDPETGERSRVPARQFLSAWLLLTERVLDTLAALQDGLAVDAEFERLRATLDEVKERLR